MRSELLRFNGTVERDPAIDAWMKRHAGELGAIAYHLGLFRGFCCGKDMNPITRSLSDQESKVVLVLTERRRRETTRAEIIQLLGSSAKAADHVVPSLRRKGWLGRATWGEYLLVPPE
jgi:hypothetical protein